AGDLLPYVGVKTTWQHVKTNILSSIRGGKFMNIRDLQPAHRHIPLHTPFKTALRTAAELESLEVTIELENGVTGKGAAAPTWVITGDSTESIQAVLLGPIKD